MAGRRRLDAEMVRRDLTADLITARALIGSNRVLVNGAIATNPTRQVAASDALVVAGPPARFVGRGAHKLDHALDAFGVDVTGLRALDAGASTGGFTDCLLQRGARHVVALDVGHGQLHERLRADARVTNLERTNVRDATVELIGGRVDVVVADLSFISLAAVVSSLVVVCHPGACMVLLVKPQFEADHREASRGRGVITDPAIHDRARERVADALVAADCTVLGWTESPITGADGNLEYLVHARAPSKSADEEAGR